MSRAFITDKEDWIYCPKAGERCLHAEEEKPCRKTDCEHFHKDVKLPTRKSSSVKIVRRQPKAEKAAAGNKPQSSRPETAPRTTKKANLKKPFKWGGRSGSNFPL